MGRGVADRFGLALWQRFSGPNEPVLTPTSRRERTKSSVIYKRRYDGPLGILLSGANVGNTWVYDWSPADYAVYCCKEVLSRTSMQVFVSLATLDEVVIRGHDLARVCGLDWRRGGTLKAL